MKVLIKRIKNYVSKSKCRAEKFSILRMLRNLFQLFFCRNFGPRFFTSFQIPFISRFGQILIVIF